MSRDFSDEFPCSDIRAIHKISKRTLHFIELVFLTQNTERDVIFMTNYLMKPRLQVVDYY